MDASSQKASGNYFVIVFDQPFEASGTWEDT